MKPIFIEFPKIARLRRECIITEKIDGTNACIYIDDEGVMHTGSRSRWITPEADNFGFAKWCKDNHDDLLTLGKGRHYGEWWGSGIQRGYGLPKGEKRFSLFNAIRWCLHSDEPKQIPTGDPRIVKYQDKAPKCCYIVPILYRGLFTTDACESAINNLLVGGSIASPGFMKPEGIICYHIASNVGFKMTIEKDDEYKSKGVTG